jgi:hypothetical protein
MLTRDDYLMDVINKTLSNEEINKKYDGICNDEKKIGEEVLLTRNHVLTILNRFLISDLSAEEVEDWAYSVFFTEDIGYEKGFDDPIKGVVMYLLEEPNFGNILTKEKAIELIQDLNNAVFDPNN